MAARRRDDGFARLLPTGQGLRSFTSPDQAAAAIEAVEGNYAAESRAARDLAIAHFDAAKVLSQLIDDAFTSS